MRTINKCGWIGTDELLEKYHDTEWGVPQRDDQILFEYLLLDSFQAGLSWRIILNKRENFRKAFDNFNARKIAKYDGKKARQLLNDAGIVRNRLKIEATIVNAQKFLEIQKEFGSFADYLWQFVGGRPIKNRFKSLKDIPATTPESDAMSHDFKKRGFKFVGSTVCYAFMQGAGLVNDHLVSCFRHKEVERGG